MHADVPASDETPGDDPGRNGQPKTAQNSSWPLADLERSVRVSLEGQVVSMGVLLEKSTANLERQSAGFQAAVGALEERNAHLQRLLEEREGRIALLEGEIKELSISRGSHAREAERLRRDLVHVRSSTSVRVGRHISGALKRPSTSWKLAVTLPRMLFREFSTRRAS